MTDHERAPFAATTGRSLALDASLLVLGLALGRWWKKALVHGTVAGPVALLATGTIDASQLLATALLAFINTGVGVAIHQGVLRLVRRVRKQPVLSDHSAV